MGGEQVVVQVAWNRRAVLGGVAAAFAVQPSARPALAAAASAPWPGGARGAVSLSYDDGLTSHWQHAAPALSARGMKASFFLTLDNMEDHVAAWKDMAAAGHELANHTVRHYCGLPTARVDSFFRREVVDAQARLDALFGPQPRLFAYPCGVTNLGPGSPDAQYQRYAGLLRTAGFIAARTSDGPPMSPHYARLHRFRLNAVAPTYETDDIAEAIDCLDLAVARGRWANLVFHGLGPVRTESGDTSNAVHEAILDAIRQRPLWCAPVGAVLNHLGVA
jgi:peptidoglycan/xylan/chitin deacetylase (PgdA/CDA1 family)